MDSNFQKNQTPHKKFKYLLTACSLAASLIPLVPTANAAEYYVATTGSDSRSATQAQNRSTPWKTLQKAGTNVPAGSVVHVAPGTYNTLTTITKSGTASAHIIFISDTKWGAKIQGSAKEALLRVNGNYVDIKNFEIIGSGSVNNGILVTGSYVQISGNKVHDISGTGIMTWNSSYNFGKIDIVNNLVYNVGRNTLNHGIYVMHQGGNVSNNIVHHAAGYGIHAWHAANGLVFSNNLVYKCVEGGLTIGAGDEPYGRVADNFVVTNNISAYNGKYGIDENGATGNNNLYKNNLVYKNGWTGFDLKSGRSHQNTLTSDPRLVNLNLSGTGDYHPTSSSPGINTGTQLGAQSNDIEGKVRKGNPDIGPHEYQ